METTEGLHSGNAVQITSFYIKSRSLLFQQAHGTSAPKYSPQTDTKTPLSVSLRAPISNITDGPKPAGREMFLSLLHLKGCSGSHVTCQQEIKPRLKTAPTLRAGRR
ncbi:hypothetical protein CHARACLAT_032139 [Characodon lateralis]|uniref:Uncharacterized protein n=1 Tax=Characodon lateralis TaxID=208331 RepID=A0ABU7F7R9_9TELE|nr:hypothetical protein [Characodon lateralis]